MRRRKRKSRQMKIIVIGSICILSVMTVGYAAFGTSLNISAKGNIVNNKNNPETIKDKYCNALSGDGLYKDTTEEGRCIYRGSNPNNYITFNNEEAGWRIVSIENDGTLKIMKMDSIGTSEFDTNNGRFQSWSEYCNDNVYGCSVWGSRTTMLDINGNNVISMPRKRGEALYLLPTEEAKITKYLNSEYYGTLNEEAKNQIDNHLWNAGPLDNSDQTLETSENQIKEYKWKGKVGLINPVDYVKASTDANCTTTKMRNTDCGNNNYLYISLLNYWTMSNLAGIYSRGSYTINRAIEDDFTSKAHDVLPALFIKSDITLSGTGTKDDPYVIK